MARYNVDLQDDKGNAYQTMANPDSVAEFSPAPSRENIRSGETYRVIFGKIMKYLSEVGNAAYVGLANNCTTTVEGFALDARQGKELMDRINELNRDLDVGSDSGMTIGSMVKAIYDKVINSAAISGHLRGGRSRGGSGTGEVTFNNIKKGSTITISSVVIPSGAGEAIKTTVDGNIVITGAGSYTLTKDGTVKITAHVYLGEEGTSGYAECDFKIV